MYDKDHNLIQFQDSDILNKQDRLGLKYLYERKRLIMMSEPGDHLSNLTTILVSKLLNKYLAEDDSKLKIQ
jgi:hypothetical protein